MQNYKPSKMYIKRTQSRDVLSTYLPSKLASTIFPDFSFENCLDMIDNDPVARGALNHFVDKCMEGDYAVIRKEGMIYDSIFELLLQEKYNFTTDIIRKVFLLGKIFNNVFVEIVRDTQNQTKALNILDTFNIQPVTEPNGDPIKYVSKIVNPRTKIYPEWDKRDVVWIKFGDRSTGYAPVDLKALFQTLYAKDFVRRYVAWLWKTGQYRVMYNFKNASSQNIADFLTFNEKHDENPGVPFISKGDMTVKTLRDMREMDSLIGLLKYYDNQITINLRIPPIDVGIPDASGRSNADAQSNNLATHVIGWKKIVEDKINFELFPKMNKGNNLLRFGPVDRFAESQVFDIIQRMKASGFSNEACEEYLRDKGLFWEAKVFDAVPKTAIKNSKEKDKFISRQKVDKNSPKEDLGDETTRSDQLVKEE